MCSGIFAQVTDFLTVDVDNILLPYYTGGYNSGIKVSSFLCGSSHQMKWSYWY